LEIFQRPSDAIFFVSWELAVPPNPGALSPWRLFFDGSVLGRLMALQTHELKMDRIIPRCAEGEMPSHTDLNLQSEYWGNVDSAAFHRK
jgi:hypothetical protein